MALSVDGRIYSWGDNDDGECGCDEDGIMTPKRVEILDEYIIEYMKVGWRHNFVATNDDQYFMFGSNADCECLAYDTEDDEPLEIEGELINVGEILNKKYDIHEIVDIALGRYNTVIVAPI